MHGKKNVGQTIRKGSRDHLLLVPLFCLSHSYTSALPRASPSHVPFLSSSSSFISGCSLFIANILFSHLNPLPFFPLQTIQTLHSRLHIHHGKQSLYHCRPITASPERRLLLACRVQILPSRLTRTSSDVPPAVEPADMSYTSSEGCTTSSVPFVTFLEARDDRKEGSKKGREREEFPASMPFDA